MKTTKRTLCTILATCGYVLLVAGVSSCNTSEKKSKYKNGHFEYSGGVWASMEYKIEELTIDNCQYIIIFGSHGRNIIHKGNCRNLAHACH